MKVGLSAGAGGGNRTLVCSLGSCRSTIELRPQTGGLSPFPLVDRPDYSGIARKSKALGDAGPAAIDLAYVLIENFAVSINRLFTVSL